MAAIQQDAKDAAAALVDTQEKVVSVELDNRRLVEQVSLVYGVCPVWRIYPSVSHGILPACRYLA